MRRYPGRSCWLIFAGFIAGWATLAPLHAATPSPLPFYDGFESGALSPAWKITGTGGFRTQVSSNNAPDAGTFHLLLDNSLPSAGYARNEVTLLVNPIGYTNLVLQFAVKSFNEDLHVFPYYSPFSSGYDFDGVAVSTNGVYWSPVLSFTNLTASYGTVSASLDGAMRAQYWAYDSNLYIRFNQYDDQSIPTDGLAFDDVRVTGNLAPQSENATVTVPEDVLSTITLPGSDPEGAPLTGTIVALPESGKLFQLTNGGTGAPITNVPAALQGGRSFVYAPSTNHYGSAVTRIVFQLNDGGAISTNATLTINITGSNDVPTAEDDLASTLAGRPLTLNPLANDWDPDGDTVTIGSFSAPARGAVVLDAGGSLVYTPNAGVESGSDTFSYVISDPAGLSATGTVTILFGPLRGGDWTTFGNGPAHTGYYPGLLGDARFVPTWSIPFTNSTSAISELVITDGVAIFTEFRRGSAGQNSNYLVGIDVDNGREVWSQPLPYAYFYPPTYDAGRIYMVQDSPHVLWCLSAQDGAVIWTNRLTSGAAAQFAPTVAAGGVWFRTGTGRMVAGFGTNGSFRFETFTGGYSWDPYWTVSYYQGLLYGSELSSVFALHPVSGEILWRTVVREYMPSFVHVAPTVAEGFAFINVREYFAAVDLSTRSLAWTNDGQFLGTPAFRDGLVYITRTNRLHAFRRSDGALVREFGPIADELHYLDSRSMCPIVTDDVVINAWASNTYVFRRQTGELLQTLPYSGRMALANGKLLITGTDVKLRAFSLPEANDIFVTGRVTNSSTAWNPIAQTFTVSNPGPGDAAGVQLTYPVPNGANVVSANPTQGSCAVSNDTVRCDLGTVIGGAQVEVAIQVVTTNLGLFIAEASISRTDVDGNPNNNSTAVSTVVELPRVTMTPFSIPEGHSNTVAAPVLISLTGTSGVPVSMQFQVSSYNASVGSDFLAATGTIVFPPGTSTQTVFVSLVGDREYELDEDLSFYVWNISNAANSTLSARCWILNDDAPPVLSISAINVPERNQGVSNAVFTLTLSRTATVGASVYVETSSETAQGGSDFRTNGAWVYFPPGTWEQPFPVAILGDVDVEPSETFRVILRNPQHVTLGSTLAICTILNDDGLPGRVDRFSFGSLPPRIDVNRPFSAAFTALDVNGLVVNNFNRPATFRLALADSNVLVGVGGSNEFSHLPFAAPHQNSAGYIHCELLYLASELNGARRITALEFPLTPDLPNNLTIRMQHTGLDAFPSPSWTSSGWTAVFATNNMYSYPSTFVLQTPFEYNGRDNLLIEFDWKADFNWTSLRPGIDTRQLRALFWSSGASYQGISVGSPGATTVLPTIRLHGDTAGVVTPESPAFSNGEWFGNVNIPVPVGTFAFQLDDRDGHISTTPWLTAAMPNDLSVQILRPEKIERNIPFQYTLVVSNSGPAELPAVMLTNSIWSANLQNFSITSSHGACVQSGDMVTCSLGSLPGGQQATITVEATPSNSSAVSMGAVVSHLYGEWYLSNNVAQVLMAQTPRFRVADVSASERTGWSETSIPITVTAWPPPDRTVSVGYSTEDGTASSAHTNLAWDFWPEFGVITFNAGQTNQTFHVRVTQDSTIESNETFYVRLREPVGGVIERSPALITILNDDVPIVSAYDTSVVETDSGHTNALILLTLSQPMVYPASVSFRTSPANASGGTDFLLTNGVITFSPGQTSQVVAIPVYGDLYDELDEVFRFQMAAPYTNLTWTNSFASCIITDNDSPPLLTITRPSVTEGNVGYRDLSFHVGPSIPSGLTITADFRTQSATALAGNDFLGSTGRLTFEPGVTNLTVTVPVIGDTALEGDEEFLLVLSNVSNATLATNTAIARILNDDGAPGAVQFFSLSSILSPQLATVPFPVTITARDASGAPVTSFTGPVDLRLLNAPSPLQNGDFEAANMSPWTLSYYPASNPTASFDVDGDGRFSKAVRLAAGYVATNGVKQVIPGHGGETYNVRAWCAVFNNSTASSYLTSRVDLIVNSNIATVLIPPLGAREVARFEIEGSYTPAFHGTNLLAITFSTLPGGYGPLEAYVDDVSIRNAAFPDITPARIESFENGVWSGTLVCSNPGPQVRIHVTDNDGHLGTSNPFDLRAYNDLSLEFAPLPATVPLDIPLSYTLVISNSGPAAANNVIVTNFLPPNVTLLSVDTSRGGYSIGAGEVRFDLGNLGSNDTAQLIMRIIPFAPGPLTNRAVVTSDLVEAWLGNNRVEAFTTGAVPVLSAGYVFIDEGHFGVTNAVLNLRLSIPRGRDVWAEYRMNPVESTVTPGIDFTGPTNWLVHFSPGVTNQSIVIPVVGDLDTESYESLVLALVAVSNATASSSAGFLTVGNDDGFWGLSLAAVQFDDAVQGNGNGQPDPGEFVHLTVALRNNTSYPISNLMSTLHCRTPGITMISSNSAYPDAGARTRTTNLTSYIFHVSKTVPCGTRLEFVHIATTDSADRYAIASQTGTGLTNVVGCTLVNNAPIALPRSFSVGSGTPHPLSLSGYDIDGDPLRFEILGASSGAQITGFNTNQGTFTYAAPDLFEGTHTVDFRVFDGVTNSTAASLTINVFRDADHDRIPDTWEAAHGLNSGNPADAAADPDLDGHSNLKEYLAGTSPNDATSVLRVTLGLDNASPALQFPAVSNRTYSIEFSDFVDASLWHLLRDVPAAPSNRIIEISDPQISMNRYYRVTTPAREE